MSYPGSQQQFGLSDLQILQQQLMLARIQELQKQQQLGQLGDGKPSSSLNNLSLFAKHGAGGQIPNIGSGTPFNASNMLASSNMNWMHHNFSSSMQGISRDYTYSHGEGLTMNPSSQQPDISLYGTPVTTGQGNFGQYSPMQGTSHSSVNVHSINSDEKPISQVPAFAHYFLGDEHSVSPGHGHFIDGSFMLRQRFQEKGSVGQASVHPLNKGMSSRNSPEAKPAQKITSPPENNRTGGQPGGIRFLREQTKQINESQGIATLDPLEEKILFDTEGSGWATSFSKLAAIDTAEYAGASSLTDYDNAFSSIQSGSWSALMQSAVAEASSSDTGMQEELSGLSFQNTDSSIGKQPSNLISYEQQHDQWTDCKLHSSSNNLSAPLSSVDSVQPKYLSRWPECQQLTNELVPAGHPEKDWVGLKNKNPRDLSQGDRTLALSQSGMIRNGYEVIQQAVDSRSYMPMNNDIDQKDCKSMGYGHQSSNNLMSVDVLYKRAAEIYGYQNRYHGENSCDSYNSKVSQAYVAQAEHASLNAEDSESSARSSHKAQNQALCLSSPGANNQLECYSQMQSDNAVPTTVNSMLKGKPNLSSDAVSKGSPASDVSASFDSQFTSEHNDASQPSDHRGTVQIGFNISQTESQVLDMPNISAFQREAIPDKFSFQSSVRRDSMSVSLGNGQKGQTWWTPSSFGHSFPPLQGASLSQSCSGKVSVIEKTGIETSNLRRERNSLRGLLPDPLHVENQLDEKHVFKESNTSESIPKTFARTSQQKPLSDSLATQDELIPGRYGEGVMPLNIWKDALDQKNRIGSTYGVSSDVQSSPTSLNASHVTTFGTPNVPDLSSLIGLPFRSSSMGKVSSDEQKIPMVETVDLLKSHEFEEKYPSISTDALAYVGSSINQQGYVRSGLVQRGSCGETLRALPNYSQSQVLHIKDEAKQQAGIADTDMNKVDCNLSPISSLNKHMIPDVPGKLPLHEMHKLAKSPVSSRFDSCSSGGNLIPAFPSGGSSSLLEISSRPATLQYIYSQKTPVFAQGYSNGNSILSDRIRHLQIRTQTEAAGYMQNTITHLSGTNASRNYGILPGLPNQMVTNEQSLPLSVVPPEANENLVMSRTKKRKTAMYDCLPWHKEVTKNRRGHPDISVADQEWAEVTNRLMEKCVDEDEKTDKIRPAVRAKRRLMLTTKLMQMVFRPPPPTVFSVDASVDYEFVTYSVTKLVLADACSLANKTRADCDMPHEIGNMDRIGRIADLLSDNATELFQRIKEFETLLTRSDRCFDLCCAGPCSLRKSVLRILAGGQCIFDAIFIVYSTQGLSKGISVVDVIVECQELQKFCVINHFARYHSRVPESVATDSGSARPFLQRYVTAVPLPLKLPEEVQCLSL